MEKKLSIVLIAIIALALAFIACAFFGLFPAPGDAGVTVVAAPEQEKAQRPDCFPDPTKDYLPLPETENLAQGKPTRSGEHTDVYENSNVNDGNTDTYWESKGFPAEMVIDLGQAHSISTVAVLLKPSPTWEARSQEIAVLVSTDGETFTEAAPSAKRDFNPDTGNRIRIDFDSVEARFVKLVIASNSSSRTGGAQAAEIQVYE